ncbi:trna binding domain-containing protein [Cystoisospora suis]|uniref:Trna binding domain-containing protein n=1 Tax=Cystoisospora suis TaxID=483139 RepID=A0A2C6KIB4_9APIC|nr:trna binding domain-containing protein [Cystoisospora suis]
MICRTSPEFPLLVRYLFSQKLLVLSHGASTKQHSRLSFLPHSHWVSAAACRPRVACSDICHRRRRGSYTTPFPSCSFSSSSSVTFPSMELLFDQSAGAMACALVGRYVRPCLKPPVSLSISYLGPLGLRYLGGAKADVPVLLSRGTEGMADNKPLHEPAAIMRCLASAAICPGSGGKGSPCSSLLGGETAFDQAQVSQWLAFCSEHNFEVHGASELQQLHSHLAPKTFFCGNHLTIADFAVFASCYAWMRSASQKERTLYCNLTRWFDHIQHLPGAFHCVLNALDQWPLVDVVPAAQPLTTSSPASDTPSAAASQQTSRPKKQQAPQARENGVVEGKKGGSGTNSGSAAAPTKKAASGGGGKAAADARPVEDVTRLKMVVGQVKKVWRHPDAEKLFCEEVDVGEPQVRQIASGLVPYMKPEDLEGQKVIVLANMKPKNLRGFASHGMLVCATSKDGSECQIMRPPPSAPIGEQITFEGLQGEPDPVMNTKEGKYPFAAVQPHFHTDDKCVGYYKTHRFMTKEGPVVCDSIVGGTIS